jgi:hypothetical protein
MTTTKSRTKNAVVPAYVPKAPDAIMAELWAFKRQANADAQYDVRALLQRIARETENKRPNSGSEPQDN